MAIYRYPASVFIIFSNDFSNKHPEALRYILAAEIRAISWMKRDNSNLLKLSQWGMSNIKKCTGKKPVLSLEERAKLTKSDIFVLGDNPAIPGRLLKQNGQIQREFEFLKSIGKIPASTKWEHVHASFDRRILKEVLADKGKYALDEFRYETNGYGNK